MKHRIDRIREAVLVRIAWALPRAVVYWAAIRLGAHATTGEYGSQVVPDLRFMDALRRWEPPSTPREPTDG